jgi:glycosyltransferase involved in cell wall biosynthesis
MVTVDLAICTFGRADVLLKIFERSVAEFGVFSRVLVIDNNPDRLPPAARERLESFSATVIHEPAMGLSRARNRALKESTADFVWFIDDDASLVPGFAEKAGLLLQTFSSMGQDSLPIFGGGFILAASDECNIDTIGAFELGLLSCMNPTHPFSQPWGANMFVNRGVALKVGGFDPQLGWVKESGALLGEEDDLYLRMQSGTQAAQAKIYFADGCAVHHWIPLWRRNFRWLCKRAFKGGRSNYLVYRSFRRRELLDVFKTFIKRASKDSLLHFVFVIGKYYQRSLVVPSGEVKPS